MARAMCSCNANAKASGSSHQRAASASRLGESADRSSARSFAPPRRCVKDTNGPPLRELERCACAAQFVAAPRRVTMKVIRRSCGRSSVSRVSREDGAYTASACARRNAPPSRGPRSAACHRRRKANALGFQSGELTRSRDLPVARASERRGHAEQRADTVREHASCTRFFQRHQRRSASTRE